MATPEGRVRPFILSTPSTPQPLLRRAKYVANVILKIGRNSGSGKTLQSGSSNAVTFYRDIHQDETRS